MEYSDQNPLGQRFFANPYEFLQNYIQFINNQIFLSQTHVNTLYALLLIQRASPWDTLRTTSPNYKEDIDHLIEKKIKNVKSELDNMPQLHEDKTKKTAFSQIEKLMGILKAKNKSIYIEKPNCDEWCNGCIAEKREIDPINNNMVSQQENRDRQRKCCCHHQSSQQNKSQTKDFRWFDLFCNLKILPNLSNIALGNCLQYNSSQKYIKFKMMKNYVMTIRNDDPLIFDLKSNIAPIPSCIIINHIFPYLTAWELFRARAVCKEWFGYVKDGWHQTFKREMFIQLLVSQFYKDIEFFYKCIQLRNPFFQKFSLLLHALVEIIEWERVDEAVQNNRVNSPFKRVLLVFLKLIGEGIMINSFNDLTEELWQQHKHKVSNIKEKVSQFLSNNNGNSMSINQLRALRTNVLNHPFMRTDEMQTQQKTPLLLLIFIKQLNLQQILKNHLYLSQQYILNCKNRLDSFANRMPHQREFLQCVYKILLLKSVSQKDSEQIEDQNKQIPSLEEMLLAIFHNQEEDQPVFFIKTKNSRTNIYMDKAIKLEIILSTVSENYLSCLNEQKMDTLGSLEDSQQHQTTDEQKMQEMQTNNKQINSSTNHQATEHKQKKNGQTQNINNKLTNKLISNTNTMETNENKIKNLKESPSQQLNDQINFNQNSKKN